LAATLSKDGVDAKNIVPAPPAGESSDIKYDELYALEYADPTTYIRFSQTVEECTGCQYDMTSEDDTFLTAYNHKRPQTSQCSEDDFEKIMEVFEYTADRQAPFAAVDNTVVAYNVMETALKQDLDRKAQVFAAEIYDYWKSRRQSSVNRPLQPSLKFEMHQDSDDGDPYVCFRRRDVRQTRKTRARDIQSTERLKILRKQLEDARRLVAMSFDREVGKRNLLNIDKMVFDQRGKVKEIRQTKGIKADDEDLINQKVCSQSMTVYTKTLKFPKPQKRKADLMGHIQRGPGTQLHLQRRPDGRAMDSELIDISTVIQQKENALEAAIKIKTQQYHNQNQNHVDLTREPLLPLRSQGTNPGFRHAATAQLMTPPASENSDSSGDQTSPYQERDDALDYRPAAAIYGGESRLPAYRLRVGRLNRQWVDRRNAPSAPKALDSWVADRFKYDQDDDDEEPIYRSDPHSTDALIFRVSSLNLPSPPRRPQIELPAISAQAQSAIASSLSQGNPSQAPT
jgi:enhancer of polycomb-like protein